MDATTQIGGKHAGAHKISREFPDCATVRAIRERGADKGVTFAQIAAEFNIAQISKVGNVVNGFSWRQCGGEASPPRRRGTSGRLSGEQVAQMRRDSADGRTAISMAQAYGVSNGTVGNALHGRTYRHITEPAPIPTRRYTTK